MLKDLEWDTLAERRAKAKAVMVHRIQHKTVDIPTTYMRSAITTDEGYTTKYHIPFSRTAAHQASFFPSSARLWNRLPPAAIAVDSTDGFRSAVAGFSLL